MLQVWLPFCARELGATFAPRRPPQCALMARNTLRLADVLTHDESFVTVGQLADYWHISRRQVLKLIETGALEAVRLGPKTYRIPTRAAADLERRGQQAYKVSAASGGRSK